MKFGHVRNRRWADDEFLARRAEALAMWPTGAEIDLGECIDYHRRLPRHKVFAEKLRLAKAGGRPLIECGIGHTTVDAQIEHMRFAQEAGVDLILVLTDTYTRKSRYPLAQEGLDRSLRDGRKQYLNGFPVVNHGLATSRRLIESVDVPLHVSGCLEEEPMLNSEMGLAAGMTVDYSHNLHDLVQHCKDYPLEQRIQTHQYTARLAAYYNERGVPIEVVNLGNYSGLMVPSVGIAITLIGTLLAAEQGAKHITVHRGQQVHLIQDVAAFRALRELAAEYLERSGHRDVTLSTHAWPWMGAWPSDESEAAGLVAFTFMVPLMAGVDWIYVKSLHEGVGIPSKESNAASIAVARQMLRALPSQRLPDEGAVLEEKEILKTEVRAILDKTLEMGDGDILVGQCRAVEAGVIDVPFSSWTKVKGLVVPVRDGTGAVRCLEFGNLPFSNEIRLYHRTRIAAREAREHRTADLEMVIEDVKSIAEDIRRDAVR